MANQDNRQTTNKGTDAQSTNKGTEQQSMNKGTDQQSLSQPKGTVSQQGFGTTGTSQPTPSTGQSTAGSTGTATATARSFIDQAKETAGQAYEAVTDKAATKLDERKSTFSGGLSTVADSVRQVSDNLGSAKTDSGLAEAAAKYTNTAAAKIENVAGYFDSRSVKEMARDLEGFARRNPAVFLGAAFGIGVLVARFLKSTPPANYSAGAGREFGSSMGTPNRASVTSFPSTSSDDKTTKPQSVANPN